MLFVVLCPGTFEGSTSSGSSFKASQKTGLRLKVSSDRLERLYLARVASLASQFPLMQCKNT